MRNISSLRAATLILVQVFACAAMEPQTGGQDQKTPAPAASSPAPASKTFVGSEACQACHEDIYANFQKNPHEVLNSHPKRGEKDHACESCHGPASSHVESLSPEEIVNPAKLTAARVDETCLTCHRNQPTHIGRIQSSHARSRVACTSCHRMHQPEAESLVARTEKAVNQQCAACHPSVQAAFQQPHAHRVQQQAMSCLSCHNPHGSFLPKQIRTFAANEPGCLNCHANLRGPFTYEHAPMRLSGCSTCHEPHGSANPKMLTRAEVRFVCLECHTNLVQQIPGAAAAVGVVPPAFHDLRSTRYQNCTVCHQKIHGSHIDRSLTR